MTPQATTVRAVRVCQIGSMPDSTAFLAAATAITGVIVGGGLQALQQRATRRHQQRTLTDDRLWSARREVYASFLMAFNEAAHVAGGLAPRPGRTVPSGPDAREEADYHFDRTVTPALRAVQLVATREASTLAADAATSLAAFRDRMTHPVEPPPEYRSDTYNEYYVPVQMARKAFIDQAVQDLGPRKP